VNGPGFRFEAPASWRVQRTKRGVEARPESGSDTFDSATTFDLRKPYDPSHFDEAARELDAVAAKLARNAHGELTSSETATVAGRKIRAYRFTAHPASGGDYEDRIGFLLSDGVEVQLLCQHPAGEDDPDGACGLLFDTFRLRTG